MTIRRITVEFVAADGTVHAHATGSVDRRAELIRDARADLERFRREHRGPELLEHGGDTHELIIRDAPAAAAWSPGV